MMKERRGQNHSSKRQRVKPLKRRKSVLKRLREKQRELARQRVEVIAGQGIETKREQKLEVYAEDISDDGSVLLLTIMNQNKKNLYANHKSAAALQNVYLWFKNSLSILYPDQSLLSYAYLSKAEQTDEICKLISAFGTGITDFKIVKVDLESILQRLPAPIQRDIVVELERQQVIVRQNKNIKNVNLAMRTREDFFIITVDGTDSYSCSTIQFSHGTKGALFALTEESDGTIRILDLLEILIAGEGKTYVIDELDRCLHPMLSYKFVETFFELAEKKNIQLIVTTHESRLMDFDLLRRDEIWFINKKINGESNIYSLEEYNARFDQKIDKAYMEGRYGGVPIFSTTPWQCHLASGKKSFPASRIRPAVWPHY